MLYLQYHRAVIQERQAHLRKIRHIEPASHAPARSIRSQLGASIIEIGRRVAGEHIATSVGTG
jgi:hypothetical protein